MVSGTLEVTHIGPKDDDYEKVTCTFHMDRLGVEWQLSGNGLRKWHLLKLSSIRYPILRYMLFYQGCYSECETVKDFI